MLGILEFLRDDALQEPGRRHVIRIDAENALQAGLSLVVLTRAAELLGLRKEIVDLVEVFNEARGNRGVAEQMRIVWIIDRVGDVLLLLEGVLVIGVINDDLVDEQLDPRGIAILLGVLDQLHVDPFQPLSGVAVVIGIVVDGAVGLHRKEVMGARRRVTLAELILATLGSFLVGAEDEFLTADDFLLLDALDLRVRHMVSTRGACR